MTQMDHIFSMFKAFCTRKCFHSSHTTSLKRSLMSVKSKGIIKFHVIIKLLHCNHQLPKDTDRNHCESTKNINFLYYHWELLNIKITYFHAYFWNKCLSSIVTEITFNWGRMFDVFIFLKTDALSFQTHYLACSNNILKRFFYKKCPRVFFSCHAELNLATHPLTGFIYELAVEPF